MPVIDVNSIFFRRQVHCTEVLSRTNLDKVGRSLKMRKLGIAPVIPPPQLL